MPISHRPFGLTPLTVSSLGLGAGHIGGEHLAEADVARLLDVAIAAGITLIDTARAYGLSEERLGRHLRGRRDALVLSSKGGYGIEGCADWTGPVITAGVDAALARLRTDRLDVFHLHSCPLEVLERGDVVDALERAQQAGKVRVIAYSGENDALAWAVASGRFGSIQTSVNLCDQRGLDGSIARAAEGGMGVIAKRPLANAPWRFPERPVGDYSEVYWERLRAMDLDPGELAWDELALRFALHAPGVTACIVGTSSVDHLTRAIHAARKGPLPEGTVSAIREAFARSDRGWEGQI